jgi:hypothetical protein
MATRRNGSSPASATQVIVRVILYYVALLAIGGAVWRYLPRTGIITNGSLDALFGIASDTAQAVGKKGVRLALPQGTLAATVALAMSSAGLLAVPVAWIYTLTRSRRGYNQSVVQLLIALPVVVAGIVVMVKYSVELAFSLAGIVAAVRFRYSLEDSKDAIYVFLMSGLGIAAAVDLPVAAVISILFNVVIIALWFTDFGRTPVALEGKMAERRLQRAKELARTGTFVARIDDEVLQNMTAEQLEGIAQRAWRRAREHDPEGTERSDDSTEVRIRVRVRDAMLTLPVLEARLDDAAKKWSVVSESKEADDTTMVEFLITPKKKSGPDELIALLRAAAGNAMVDSELR